MKKLPILIGAAFVLAAAPALADVESETRVEERVEQDGLDERRTRTVETERESGSSTRSVERRETIDHDAGDVDARVEQRTETETETHIDD